MLFDVLALCYSQLIEILAAIWILAAILNLNNLNNYRNIEIEILDTEMLRKPTIRHILLLSMSINQYKQVY